jgi:predicted RNA-binding Zn-ribbon protein involved in translation (DUF1610 family)
VSQPIGRMALGKSIVITGSRGPQGVATRSAASDLVCPSCGTLVCEGERRTLFVGMVLRCNGCGERNAVLPAF